MSTASPTPPIPNSNSRFPPAAQSSKSNNFASSLQYRPLLHRTNAMRADSFTDDSDDEVPLPPSFDSLFQSPIVFESVAPSKRVQDSGSGRERTTLDGSPRRVVRLSSSAGVNSGYLGRSTSGRNPAQTNPEDGSLVERAASTPLPEPRKVRIRVGSGGRSSAKSTRAVSIPLSEGEDSVQTDNPVTFAKPLPSTNQSSILRYGQSTIDRTRDTGISIPVRVVKRIGLGKGGGTLMSGPARRGKLRKSEEVDHSRGKNNGKFGDLPTAAEDKREDWEPAPAVQHQESNQIAARSSVDAPVARDFEPGGPRKVRIPSTRTSPQGFADGFPPIPRPTNGQTSPNGSLPVPFKIPTSRVGIPSAHDQENEPPPLAKRPMHSSALFAEKHEKSREEKEKANALPAPEPVKVRNDNISPERKPLQPRSHNTPHRPAPPPPPHKSSTRDTAPTADRTAAGQGKVRKNMVKVNGKLYHKLGELGRGGSSRVTTVMSESQKMYALKRVDLEEADEAALMGYKGEIELLKKLKGVERVITLHDYELNEAKKSLFILLEPGEIDFIKLLEFRLLKCAAPCFDVSFTRHYWKEMLECIQAVHEHDIVHTDLKPANFVLVRGRLKLIDFGIANAIDTDETLHVHRESMHGTPNYMSPESLTHTAQPGGAGAARIIKLGKPSDIWSLGCILYQMTYGRAPFAHITSQYRRIEAILDPHHPIDYPARGVGGTRVPESLMCTMRRCLERDAAQRPSAAELLSERDHFLYPDSEPDMLPVTEHLLGRILTHVAARLEATGPVSETELAVLWPRDYFESIRRSMSKGTF